MMSVLSKFENYFGDMWNRFDFVVYLLFITSIILRLLLDSEQFVWARMVYTVDLMLFFVRFLQFFFASKIIGPKVIIIRGMVRLT